MNIFEKTTYLRKKLSNDCECADLANFYEADYLTSKDLEVWCNIINQSYSDVQYSVQSAKKFFENHPFITDYKTAFYFMDGIPVATISYGRISMNMAIGAFFRIAVLPSYQKIGIGKKLIRYAERKMFERGISRIEEAIVLKRDESLMMHFSLGYIPEYLSVERSYRRSFLKELISTASGYNLLINIITWNRFIKYKRRMGSMKKKYEK